MTVLRLGLLLLCLVAGMSFAQSFPSKPLRIVVPFPGGVADALSRMIAPKMGEALGQPVVVENKPGGSGSIGAQEVIRAPADGHTIFLGHIGTHAVNPHVFSKLSYDPEKDLAPGFRRLGNRFMVRPLRARRHARSGTGEDSSRDRESA